MRVKPAGWSDYRERPRIVWEQALALSWLSLRQLGEELNLDPGCGSRSDTRALMKALDRLEAARLVERTLRGDGVPLYRKAARLTDR